MNNESITDSSAFSVCCIGETGIFGLNIGMEHHKECSKNPACKGFLFEKEELNTMEEPRRRWPLESIPSLTPHTHAVDLDTASNGTLGRRRRARCYMDTLITPSSRRVGRCGIGAIRTKRRLSRDSRLFHGLAETDRVVSRNLQLAESGADEQVSKL
jgi:hypothetical protein